MDKISVIIPVYGDKNLVRLLYDELVKTLCNMDIEYEIIMVNDNCPYGSGEEIEKLALEDNHVKFVDLVKNVGQHLAIKAGIDVCSGNYAIIMDCDLQDNPQEIPNFYQKIKNIQADVVLGLRKSRKESYLKKIYSKSAAFIIQQLSDAELSENDKRIGNYSIMNKKVIDTLKSNNEPYFIFTAIIHSMGFSKDYMLVEQEKRKIGSSNYNFFKGFRLLLRTLVSNSNKPLLLSAFFAAILFLLCGLLTLKVVIWHFIFGQRIIGYTSIMASIYLIGGMLFLNLGVMSLYIGQIFKMTQDRPLYIVKNKVNL